MQPDAARIGEASRRPFTALADFGASLADPLAATVHARVERWMMDELAMPGRLFEEPLERLYREDRLVNRIRCWRLP